MAAAMCRAIERAQAGAIYNVCAEPVQQRDYLRELNARLGTPPPTSVAGPVFPSPRCSSAHRAWASISRDHVHLARGETPHVANLMRQFL